MTRAFDGTNTTFYLSDPEGTVLLSFSQNAIQGEQVSDPYGYSRYQVGNLNTAKGYTGQIQDSLTGLDYDHARYYNKDIGVFLSPDSKQGNAQGDDPYAYVAGNPETLTDPTGQRRCVSVDDCPAPPPPPTNGGGDNGGKGKGGSKNPCDVVAAGMHMTGGGCVYNSGSCQNKTPVLILMSTTSLIIMLSIVGISWYLSLREKHRETQREQEEQSLSES